MRPGFDPWVGKMPWRRDRLPAPVFWPGEFHGLYSLTKSWTRLRDFHFLWELVFELQSEGRASSADGRECTGTTGFQLRPRQSQADTDHNPALGADCLQGEAAQGCPSLVLCGLQHHVWSRLTAKRRLGSRSDKSVRARSWQRF